MKLTIKSVLSLIIIQTVILTTIFNCNAQGIVNSSIDVPAQIEKNKNFTLSLNIQCDEPVSVVIFTLSFGNSLEYSSCKVNDNSNGYMVEFKENNTLKVTYINTTGINVSSTKTLIDITMKATEFDKTWLEVHTTNSTGSNEQLLSNGECIHYDIEIVEKVTSDSSASGRTINSSSSSNKNSSAINNSNDKNSTNNKAIPNGNNDNSSEITNSSTEPDYDTVAVSGINNSVMLFIAGGSFALAVVAVIFISYKTGKHNSTKVSQTHKIHSKEDSGEIYFE
ncbi:MAG: hypothetical protein UH239_10300 [Acutalibacteraceae bacterium]|nr:hypothetical protein [Acutalibacteraceae bacterium]